MAARAPVAIRNNNPGNLRFVPRVQWQGQTGAGDLGFARFATPAHGFRAAARQILTYADRDGLRTVRAIITRWAPPKGQANGVAYTQNTDGYVAAVAARLRVLADDPINVRDPVVMRGLLVAIAEHEAGLRWPFAGHGWSDAMLDDGLRMAGLASAAARGVGRGLENTGKAAGS